MLLLHWLVESLVQDANARLAVFKAHTLGGSTASKHELESLLTQSELWRTIAPVSFLPSARVSNRRRTPTHAWQSSRHTRWAALQLPSMSWRGC